MAISGTVQISLSDYARLHKLAKRALRHGVLLDNLLTDLSSFVTAVAYDESMDEDQTRAVLEHLRTLSASNDSIRIYNDPEKYRIHIRLAQPTNSE